MGIPLVALMGRQPQIENYQDMQARAAGIQNMRGQNALQPGELQEQQQRIQAQKQAQADNQTAMQALAQTKGDLGAAIPQLAGKISIPAYQSLVKDHTAHLEAMAKMDSEELATRKDTADRTSAIVDQAMQMDDQTYLANWPMIANAANKVNPTGKLDPNNPMPRQKLQMEALGLKTTQQYIDQEKARRDASKEAREAADAEAKRPGEIAKGKIAEQDLALGAEGRAGTKHAPTEASIAYEAAGGDPNKAIQILDASKRASRPINVSNMGSSDVKDIADAIENGDQPPTMQGLYRNGAPVRAELARRGVPIAKMEMDWKATQKYISTLNGSQQTRLRQDISTTSDTLDKVEKLYDEWAKIAPTSGFKVLNKSSLAAMKQLPGRPGAVAHALENQIADTTAGLGTIYMGGNTPTDHSLDLAAKALSADWNDATFREALKQARSNIKIRQNSMLHSAPAGASADNPYAPKDTTGGSQAPAGNHPFAAQFGGTVRQ